MLRAGLLLLAATCAVAATPAAAQDLDAAIAGALAHAPLLAEADAGQAAAEARVRQAVAERNPLLRLDGSAGFGRIDNGGFFGISADEVVPLSVQAAAEMPLFTGGRLASAAAQAGAGRDAARHGVQQIRQEVILRAVGAYVEVLSARKVEARFRQFAAALATTARQAALRFEVGEIAASEMAQARARAAEAEAGLAQAEGRRINAEAAFERLTALPAGELAPLPTAPAVPASLEEARELALAANPLLLQAAAAARASDAGVRASRAAASPVIGAFAEAAHVADQFFPGYRADSMAVGLRGRWTLFSGGRTRAAVAIAQAEADGSAARLREARLQLDGAVIAAWQDLHTAARVLEATQLRAAAAAESLRGRRLEAQVGAVPTLAVLDAERDAAEADAALTEAQGLHLLAGWRLNALAGQL